MDTNKNNNFTLVADEHSLDEDEKVTKVNINRESFNRYFEHLRMMEQCSRYFNELMKPKVPIGMIKKQKKNESKTEYDNDDGLTVEEFFEKNKFEQCSLEEGNKPISSKDDDSELELEAKVKRDELLASETGVSFEKTMIDPIAKLINFELCHNCCESQLEAMKLIKQHYNDAIDTWDKLSNMEKASIFATIASKRME